MSLKPGRSRIRANPSRTEPNGFCVDCGIKLSTKTALRCRRHWNLLHNRAENPGTFTRDQPDRARYAASDARIAKRRAMEAEIARLRALLAAHGIDPDTGALADTPTTFDPGAPL